MEYRKGAILSPWFEPGFLHGLTLPWLDTFSCRQSGIIYFMGMSNLWPVGCMGPRMAVNEVQHKIINLLKMLWDSFVIMCCDVFNVWLKTTLLLPVWPRDAKELDSPVLEGWCNTSVRLYAKICHLVCISLDPHTLLIVKDWYRGLGQMANKALTNAISSFVLN